MSLINKKRKARSIKKALEYFDPHHPLWDENEMEAFYVDRNGKHLDEMERIFLRASDYPKLLLSGPPGSGKATELAKLNERLWKKFNIIRFSAKQMTSNFEVKPEVVLNTILRIVGNIAKSKKLKIFDEKVDPLIKRTQGWETKISDVDTKGKKYDPATVEKIEKGEIIVKGPIKHKYKVMGKPTANEVITTINEMVTEIEKRRFLFFKGKKVLLFFVDMDKLEFESAKNIFIKTFLNLTKINCCAVFTFPLALKYDSDFVRMYRNFSGIYFLENFKVIDKNGRDVYSGMRSLVELIQKRVANRVIYREVIIEAIRMSGGILFELINIIRECCIIALREKVNYIDLEILVEAGERIRFNYKIGLKEEDIQILRQINNQKIKPDTVVLTKLLNQYSITEYGEGEDVWYGVNPILKPIIRLNEVEEE